jgi:LacI family transcriptional regulator, galactose operon repressor
MTSTSILMKKITIAELAKQLQLSPTTVSFVLNNHQNKGISDTTRQRVLDYAATVGYNRVQRSVLDGWTKVAFLTERIEFFNFNTSFFAGVYSFLNRKSPQHKLEFFLRELQLEDEVKAFHRLRQMNSLGIKMFLTSSVKLAEFLIRHDQQVILIQGGSCDKCIAIRCDDYAAGKVTAEYALKMGHRTAGTIFPDSGSPRFNGFYDTFTSGGGSCPDNFRWIISMQHDETVAQLTKLAAMPGLPQFFYCFADNIMFPALRAFAVNNLKVPDDISLVGADNLYWGRYSQPAFTTVDLSEELFADKVIDAIAHAINNTPPYELKVPVKLIERETVRGL